MNPKKNRTVVSLNLDNEVLGRVDEYSESTGLSRSDVFNFQMRVALNLVDEDTMEWMKGTHTKKTPLW